MFDAGDGPAVFVILIVGAIVCAAALYVEFTFQPPYWVHAVLWIPTVTILTLRSLAPGEIAAAGAAIQEPRRRGAIEEIVLFTFPTRGR